GTNLLPDTITSLTFDAQGRLLVGTSGGLIRGVALGFGYDFSSGGTGILQQGGGFGGGGSTFFVPGMTFTSLNGNLQISDMTSVSSAGLTQNELLFGTDKVYFGKTSGVVLDPKSGSLGQITALAFGPDEGVWYAGTQAGGVFVTLNSGTDGFPQRGAGVLPTA